MGPLRTHVGSAAAAPAPDSAVRSRPANQKLLIKSDAASRNPPNKRVKSGWLIGPSSTRWGKGSAEYGRVAFINTDGGTASPPEGGTQTTERARPISSHT